MNQFVVLFTVGFATNILFRFAMEFWSKGTLGVTTFDVIGAAVLAVILAWLLPKVKTAIK
jgi:hypothetical protein